MDVNDHRIIAQRLDLYHQQEEGPGVIFWHPRGFALYHLIQEYVRKRMQEDGFLEIKTPQLLARSLWEASGHWEKFGQNMFVFEDGEKAWALKPMSCPGHIQVFKQGSRSYRDLPLRLCEFGDCHRYEPSGALQGFMRTRAFTQDDAHIFCAEEHVAFEVDRFCRMLHRVYADFGFEIESIGFSTRPVVRAGSEEVWDRAEKLLYDAARQAGLDPVIQPGEGAFYGPKLEFILRDSQGRCWQCGTIQLDYVLPDRLDARYAAEGGRLDRPVLLHQAVLGSIERFMGILLEQYAGNLPLWLAPEQVVVASIQDDLDDYAREVAAFFRREGFRVALDLRSERLSRKIVDAREKGIPVVAIVGERERQDRHVSLRFRDGRQQVLSRDAAARILGAEIPGAVLQVV